MMTATRTAQAAQAEQIAQAAQATTDRACISCENSPKVKVRNLAFTYPRTDRAIFEALDFDVCSGQILSVLGNNGCGKSTLLDLLSGISRPTAGRVSLVMDGSEKDVARLSTKEIARHVAYVTQNQRVPHLTVYDEVLLGRKPHITWNIGERDYQIVEDVLERLDLGRYATRHLDELSGGERQKVIIARALAQEPEVLLLDEPTSALDLRNQLEVLELVQELTYERNLATIIVIHDVNLAIRYSDQFLLLRDGLIVDSGYGAATEENLSSTYGVEVRRAQIDGIDLIVPHLIK